MDDQGFQQSGLGQFLKRRAYGTMPKGDSPEAAAILSTGCIEVIVPVAYFATVLMLVAHES